MENENSQFSIFSNALYSGEAGKKKSPKVQLSKWQGGKAAAPLKEWESAPVTFQGKAAQGSKGG